MFNKILTLFVCLLLNGITYAQQAQVPCPSLNAIQQSASRLTQAVPDTDITVGKQFIVSTPGQAVHFAGKNWKVVVLQEAVDSVTAIHLAQQEVTTVYDMDPYATWMEDDRDYFCMYSGQQTPVFATSSDKDNLITSSTLQKFHHHN